MYEKLKRMIKLGIEQFANGQKVRDRFTGTVLRVVQVRQQRAKECRVRGTCLSQYGENRKLSCSNDFVVDCRFLRSHRTYGFPQSRLVPGIIPGPKHWRENVRNSWTCFTCGGRKDKTTASVCPQCRAYIFGETHSQCQQKGCDTNNQLQIHHLSYQPNSEGRIPPSQLIVLCQYHHQQRHRIQQRTLQITQT